MWRRLGIIVTVGVCVLILAELYGPGGRQRRGEKAAEQLRASIAPLLASDPRFAAVEAWVMTHPSLRFSGDVPNAKALEDLKSAIHLPPHAEFRIIWHVHIASDAEK